MLSTAFRETLAGNIRAPYFSEMSLKQTYRSGLMKIKTSEIQNSFTLRSEFKSQHFLDYFCIPTKHIKITDSENTQVRHVHNYVHLIILI